MKNMTDARFRLIVTGILGVMLTTTLCTLYIIGRAVPELLPSMVVGVWGFFTGHVYTNGTGAMPKAPPEEKP